MNKQNTRASTPALARAALCAVCLGLLSTAPADAAITPITSGQITMGVSTPAPFDDVLVILQGPDLSLTNEFLRDSFHFTGIPNPAFQLLPPGTVIELDGHATLVAPGDLLVLNGNSYRASGTLSVSTGSLVVAALMTVPFGLTGHIHGVSLSGPSAVDLDIFGSGLVTARYTQLFDGKFAMEFINYEVFTGAAEYEVSAIPEPSSMLLLGLGLFGLAGRRK